MERFVEARQKSDKLFAVVRPEFLQERPIPERHRIVFYMGHMEAFDWNLLQRCVAATATVDPTLDRLFAFGIDPVGGGLPTDTAADWPELKVVRDYVGRVRFQLDARLGEESEGSGQRGEPSATLPMLLNVAIEHRLMHLETLAYMLHQLPLSMKIRQGQPPTPRTSAVEHRMLKIPSGRATLGLSRSAERFGWDNEYEAHSVKVPPFEIDRYKVTNRQFLEFVAAGGYGERAFWSDADWQWKSAKDVEHPLFWKRASEKRAERSSGAWLLRTMFDEVPFEESTSQRSSSDNAVQVLDWPVYVSHAEASAYGRWAGMALPSEAEWQRAAYGAEAETQRDYPWGNELPDAHRGNFDFQRWDPVSVNAFPQSRSAFGVEDLLGNGWEWTSTAFAPFPGFAPFPFYAGYSANFFDGQHFVMKGGSARTAACMLRPSFRNWFQPHYQYVYAGFRCVRR